MANPEGRHGAPSIVLCEVDGFAVELSPDQLRPSGAFIATDSPQPMDREITMVLHSPFGEAVLRALVVQVIWPDQAAQSGRTAGYGVLFLDLADDQRAFIGLTLDALDRAQRAEAAAEAARRRMTPPKPRQRIPSSPLEPPHHATRKRKLSSEGADILRKLRTELEKLPTRTPFAVLGVEADADAETARTAFLEISKRCHPHVYARLDSPEINTAATELFIAYKRAYATVRTLARPSAKPSARAAAPRTSIPHEIEMLPSATPSSPPPHLLKSDCTSSKPSPASSEKPARASIPPPASPPPAARALAQHLGHQLPPRVSMSPVQRSAPRDRSAVVPLRASQPQATAPNSERSVDPRRTFDAEVALGSALKHLASSRFDHAELELEQLCLLRPGHRDAQIWLRVCRGRRLKAERKAELAQEEYRAVLELDPEHREALENVGPRRRRGGGIGGKWFDGGDE